MANAIIDNRIRVAVDSSLDHAEYDHLQDALFLPWEAAADDTRKALIVHEVVHAALDKAHSDFLVYQSETAAYLAQMMFMLAAARDGADKCHGPDPAGLLRRFYDCTSPGGREENERAVTGDSGP